MWENELAKMDMKQEKPVRNDNETVAETEFVKPP